MRRAERRADGLRAIGFGRARTLTYGRPPLGAAPGKDDVPVAGLEEERAVAGIGEDADAARGHARPGARDLKDDLASERTRPPRRVRRRGARDVERAVEDLHGVPLQNKR